jgi:NADH-quinone oxidoreductase subunit G
MAPVSIGLILDEQPDLTYPYTYLGAGTDTLASIAKGEHSFLDVLKKAERPLVIVGEGGLGSLAAAAALAKDVGAVTDGWNGFGVLNTAAARVGALDLGFVPGPAGMNAADMAKPRALQALFLLGADEIEIEQGAFVVYIGTHGDRGAHRADVILPGAAYPEKSGLYVNTEGRVQLANRAAFPPGDAREDWAIIRALSDVLGHKLPFDSLAELRRALYKEHPHFMKLDQIERGDTGGLKKLAAGGGDVDRAGFRSSVSDFYLTNPIARASAVMAECSALASGAARTAAE